MSFNLTVPRKFQELQQLFNQINQGLNAAFMKRQDVRLQNGERLILKDTVTGTLYSVEVHSGVLTVVATT